MKDDYKEYFDSDEANQDSKSDAKVILFDSCCCDSNNLLGISAITI